MKITDLAALVQVRNHILTVINDKSVTNRDEFRPLNEARMKLDKKFVEAVKTLDVETLFDDSSEYEYWKSVFKESQKPDKKDTTFPYHPQKLDSQLPLPFDNETDNEVLKDAANALTEIAGSDVQKLEEKLDKLEEQNVKIEPALVEEAAKPIQAPEEVKQAAVEKARKAKQAEAAEDPEIADAIARQKAELKKQGRSNKKVKRSNDE